RAGSTILWTLGQKKILDPYNFFFQCFFAKKIFCILFLLNKLITNTKNNK
ncbi:unnamed protein product, partial [Arabidopsis halleri]